MGAPAGRGDLLRQLVADRLLADADDDVGARIGEGERQRMADAAGGARDQCDATLEAERRIGGVRHRRIVPQPPTAVDAAQCAWARATQTSSHASMSWRATSWMASISTARGRQHGLGGAGAERALELGGRGVELGHPADGGEARLGVELHAVAGSPDPEGLVRVPLRARQQHRLGRQHEGVGVPVERRDGVGQAAEDVVVAGGRRAVDRRRPDLGHLARVDLAAERQREQLRAEAHAVHRHVGGDGLAQQLELRLEPVEARRVVEALRPAQRDHAVVAGERGRDRIAGLEVGELRSRRRAARAPRRRPRAAPRRRAGSPGCASRGPSGRQRGDGAQVGHQPLDALRRRGWPARSPGPPPRAARPPRAPRRRRASATRRATGGRRRGRPRQGRARPGPRARG